jgi:hypothetical protein
MDDAMITDVPVSEIIDGAYKEFAMYTLEQRAIPSAIDGMKPVHRKLVYAMLKDYSTGKVKVAELGGSLSSCLSEDTIVIVDSEPLTIKEAYNSNTAKNILSYNIKENKEVNSEILNIKNTGMKSTYFRIYLESGEFIDATPEHLFLLKTGEWKEAQYLTLSDEFI